MPTTQSTKPIPAQWLAHVEQWRASGLTRSAYCEQHGINPPCAGLLDSAPPRTIESHWHPNSDPGQGCRATARRIVVRTDPALPQWQQTAPARHHARRMAWCLTESITMITAPIWLVHEPVDMRIGIEGLCARLAHSLDKSPSDGCAYVFRNRRTTRIKVLMWDHTGVWLCQRRLHQGSFVWPGLGTPVFELSQAQWNWLITGVDWQRLSPQKQPEWRF